MTGLQWLFLHRRLVSQDWFACKKYEHGNCRYSLYKYDTNCITKSATLVTNWAALFFTYLNIEFKMVMITLWHLVCLLCIYDTFTYCRRWVWLPSQLCRSCWLLRNGIFLNHRCRCYGWLTLPCCSWILFHACHSCTPKNQSRSGCNLFPQQPHCRRVFGKYQMPTAWRRLGFKQRLNLTTKSRIT